MKASEIKKDSLTIFLNVGMAKRVLGLFWFNIPEKKRKSKLKGNNRQIGRNQLIFVYL